jgi:hypothetical protein
MVHIQNGKSHLNPTICCAHLPTSKTEAFDVVQNGFARGPGSQIQYQRIMKPSPTQLEARS